MIEISTLRRRIDHLDDSLVNLLDRRMANAVLIAEVKAKRGLLVEDARREERLLRRLFKLPHASLSNASLYAIFKAILTESKRAQHGARTSNS